MTLTPAYIANMCAEGISGLLRHWTFQRLPGNGEISVKGHSVLGDKNNMNFFETYVTILGNKVLLKE